MYLFEKKIMNIVLMLLDVNSISRLNLNNYVIYKI
jgi:hypothetical protein